MRLFIGVPFSPEVVVALDGVSANLKPLLTKGRLVHSDNLHLTLQFLGETPAEKVPAINAALTTVAAMTSGFRLTFDHQLGYFGRPTMVRVVWLGICSNLALAGLQSQIAAAMVGVGFFPGAGVYVPHVTLARDVRFGDVTRLQAGHVCWQLDALPQADVNNFCLFASRVENGRRRHFRLATFALLPSGG